MVNIIPSSPIKSKVERTQVSEKNPHHEQNKKKRNKDNEEVHDEVTLSEEAEEEVIHSNKERTKSPPKTPMQGHIDIEA